MKKIKKWTTLSLLFVNIAAINACNSPNAMDNKEANNDNGMQKTQLNKLQPATSNVQAELDKAKKMGKAVFVVVTGAGATDVEKAISIAKSATAKYKNSVIVQMDRDNAANSNFVNLWRLAGAPLPIILVLSPKGYLTGGFVLNDATVEKIVGIVPSPKLDDVYAAINNGKSVLLIVSKKSYTDRAKIIENCKAAKTQLQNNAEIIEIDITDAKEQNFIKQLNLKNTPNTSTVLVLNKSGQTTGSYEGKVESSELVLAANKVIKSGCGSSCAPGSCGPKK